MIIVDYIVISLAILAVGFVGWFGVAQLLVKYKNFDEKMAFFISILAFISSWLIYGLVLFFLKIFYPIALIIPIVALVPFAVKFAYNLSREIKIVTFIFLLQFLLGLIIQLFLPYYPIGSDWFDYYRTSQQYLAGDFGILSGRPPIFNILSSMYLEIFSNHFWVNQISSVFLNSLLIIPLYMIAENFDKKHAYWTLIFVALNPFVLQNTVYTWPRNLSVFFILYSYYFILQNKMKFVSVASALGFFTHISTIFFIIPGYIFGYLKKNKKILASLVILAILIAPLLIYYALNTQPPSSVESPDQFFIYPFAVNGYESLLTESPSTVMHDFLSRPFYYTIGVRLVNFVMTTTPAFAVLKIVAAFVSIPAIIIQKTVVISQLPAIYYWLLSYPGALSSLVYIFTIIGLYSLFKRDRKIFWLLMSPLILGLLYWGWIKAGIVNDLLQTSVPLFIMVGVSQMRSEKWIYISLVVMILESLLFWHFYIGLIPSYLQSIPIHFPPVPNADKLLSIDSINSVINS